MSHSYTEMLARLKSGEAPSTDEFAQSFAEIQQEIRDGAKPKTPAYVARRLNAAEARVLLISVLKHLEQHDLPKMIADAELLRRQLGMPSMLFKQLGDFL